MTLDAVQAVHVLDTLRAFYAESWPALTERLKSLPPARRETPPDIAVAEWVVQYLAAALALPDTATTRRRLIAAVAAAGGESPLAARRTACEAREEEVGYAERVQRTAKSVREQLAGQSGVDRLDGGVLRESVLRDFPELKPARWDRAAAGMVRDLTHDAIARVVAEWMNARSAVEIAEIARRRLPGLSVGARARFLERVGFAAFSAEPRRVECLRRLGWLDGADGRSSDASRQRALRLVNQLAQWSAYGPSQQSLLVGLLTGQIDDARAAGVPSFCAAKPRCIECPLRGHCTTGRVQGEAPAAAARLPIRRWAKEDRPREKALAGGVEKLTEAELLALLLRHGAGGRSALDLAQELLARFGHLEGLDAATPGDIEEAVAGIGPAKAVELKAALELGRRMVSLRLERGCLIQTSGDVYRALYLRFRHLKQEVFQMLVLSSKNELIDQVEISRGTLNASLVHPRDVFKHAVVRSASAVIFIHNHPSGDPTPSDADHDITRRLREAAGLLGIRMLDHIILGRNCYYSFTDKATTQSAVADWE